MKSNIHHQAETAAQRRARDADQLVAAARAGDAAAFGRLVRRFRPRIYALALHLSGSASDADDIAQDAFVQAYRHMRQFQGRSHFFTWLYRITVNRALSKQREHKHGFVSLDDVRVEVAMQIDAPTDPRLALELRETYRALLEGLDALSPSLKSAVVLTALQGLSYPEAAVVLGTTEGAIAVRIHEARKQLRVSLANIHARRASLVPKRTPPYARHERAAGRADAHSHWLNPELALALASVL